MKTIKGKAWMFAIALALVAVFGWVLWQNIRITSHIDANEKLNVMIDGVYSIDGGEWKPIDNEKPIEEHFHKAVFKGKFSEELGLYSSMEIVCKNVWYTIKDADGNYIDGYRHEPGDDYDYGGIEYIGDKLTDTPGYTIYNTSLEYDDRYKDTGEKILEVEFPYEFKTESFSDCFYVVLSYSDGMYHNFIFEALPPIIMFLIVCFFGVFFFPIASGMLGRIDFRYIAFGALCFFAGFYMVMGKLSNYMYMWIPDPTVCMMTYVLACYMFSVSVMLYLRSLLQLKATRIIASSVATAFFVLMIVNIVLHMTNTADLMATVISLYIAGAVSTLIMTILLCIEIKGKRKFELVDYLVSWVPLVFFVSIDILDMFVDLYGKNHLRIGLAITIVYQLVRFGMDFRRQYKEAIRYQQVQKELYEAKVSVMVSQIRPHFMYNALSSIAILCKLNPDTAYTATVTFSDYLRGNMDSLKQTSPVPFTKELEHLKKYLYIEKLRFDDQLNIEYDIQATDFEIPLLSVQPLAENAVKHGVGMKEDGGTVKISSRETENAFEVIVEDDGVGFDVNEKKDDGRSHVGMENTKKRLKDMCGGEVIITSEVGVGTTARIVIPKDRNQ